MKTLKTRSLKTAAQRGFSMLELLIALGIIGIMLGLLVPAVLAARENSRRLTCSNSLYQLGLGASLYVDAYSVFPKHAARWDSLNGVRTSTAISFLRYADPQYAHPAKCPDTIPMLVCPSDSVNSRSRLGLSYRATFGSTAIGSCYSDGALATSQWINPKEVTDGLSNTSLMSERSGIPHTSGYFGLGPRRHLAVQVTTAPHADPLENNERAIEACEQSLGLLVSNSGPDMTTQWFDGGCGHNEYSHAYLPNMPVCVQFMAPVETGDSFLTMQRGASSEHAGGVNVAFCDGHVKFISDSIDKAVWRAMGTRAGNDNTNE
jgi:prepilin-type processing-associated H-X9-DG protein/prepilin-type N-terminal cleavage/methylation domain-containing protein